MFSSQKSFSLVLEALDYDNDTTESGKAAVYVYVSICMHTRLDKLSNNMLVALVTEASSSEACCFMLRNESSEVRVAYHGGKRGGSHVLMCLMIPDQENYYPDCLISCSSSRRNSS